MELAASLPEIPGYELIGVLGSGATSVVYRGLRDKRDVAIKVMNTRGAGAELLFRQEVAALARLDHPSVLKVIEGGECAAGSFLVTELIDGEPLSSLLKKGPTSEEDLVRYGKLLAGALGEVHRYGLVHRDVKPGNIVVLPSGDPVLIDFGLVGRIQSADQASGEVVGTFLYGAPEQTGMLNRRVDERSDLYSLGCVLFECALGRPPFLAQSHHELVRLHAAQAAPDVHAERSEIRPSVSRIIAKLLAKDPEDRYQTAGGLIWDLEHLSDLDSGRVQLGSKDSYFRMVPDIPLVGREEPLRRLQDAWSKAQLESSGSIFQVEGEPGGGKTRLISEVLQGARDQGALVLFGKAQKEEKTPFGPLRDAITELVNRIRQSSAAEAEEGRQKLLRATDVPGIVKRLSRNLGLLFGDVPEMRMLDGDAEQERFYEKVADFFVGLAREYGGAILLVDDIQWLDDGTLRILKKLAVRLDTAPLLLATTARNDPDSEEARKAFLEHMKAARTQSLTLQPLGVGAVGEFIAAHLGGRSLDQPTVERLAVKSNGNPFALGQYVRALLDQGVLNPTADGWEVDEAAFHDIVVSNDVVALLLSRVSLLGDEGQRVLSAAAILGFAFEQRVLEATLEQEADVVRRGLDEAIRANLIEQQGEQTYLFVHDRVQEAMLAQLDEERAKDLNQAAAEAIHAVYGGDLPDDALFAVARHYAAGHADRHQDKVFASARAAGLSALDQYSNEEAFGLLSRALEASANVPSLDEAERTHLEELVGLACARTGRLDLAKEHFARTLARVKTQADRARLHYLTSLVYSSEGNNEVAWEENLTALRLMGVRFPKSRLFVLLAVAYYFALTTLKMRTGWGFGTARGEARERAWAVCRMLSAGYFTIYYMGNWLRTALCSFLRVNYAIQLGAEVEYPKALATHAMLISNLFGHFARGTLHNLGERAIGMAEQLGDNEAVAYTRGCVGCALDYNGETVFGQEMMWDALPNMVKYCIARDAGLFIGAAGISVTHRGRSRESVEKMETWLPTHHRMGTQHYIANVYGALYVQFTLLGRAREGLRFKADQQKIAKEMANVRFVQSFLHCHTICALYEQDDLGKEFEEAVKAFIDLNFDHPLNRIGHVMYCYGRLEQFMRSQGVRERKQARARLMKALRTATWGPPLRCALNPVHRCHIRTIHAAVAREEGHYRQALRLLARAEDDASSSDSLWGMWSIHRERARVWACQGDEYRARLEAERALEVALEEGWRPRANRIRWEFNLETDQLPSSEDPLNLSIGPLSYATHTGRGARTRTQGLLRVTNNLQGRTRTHGLATSRMSATRRPGSSSIPSSSVGLTGTLLRSDMSSQRYLEALLDVTLESSSTLDEDEQYGKALQALIRSLAAERGFLFIATASGELEMVGGRDAEGTRLGKLEGYSSTVVKKVFADQQPLVVTGTEEGEALGSESAVSQDLRSIMAAPINVRDKRVGVLYVDSRVMKGLFTEEHITLLQAIANQVGVSLESARQAREQIQLESERSEMKKDLEVVAAVQSMCLPEERTHTNGPLTLASAYIPAATASGDWWWYDDNNAPGQLNVFLGDVTGHGAGAAMLTACVAGCYRTLKRALGQVNVQDLLGHLTHTVRAIAGGNMMMTMSAVLLDAENQVLVWWNAAGPPLLVLRADGSVDALTARGLPLGSERPVAVKAIEAPFGPGDRLLMYTDGLVERTVDGKLLNLRRLSNMLKATREQTAHEALKSLLEGAQLPTEPLAPGESSSEEDDITLLVLDYDGEPMVASD